MILHKPCSEGVDKRTNFLFIHRVEVEVNHPHQLKEKEGKGFGLLFGCSGRDSNPSRGIESPA